MSEQETTIVEERWVRYRHRERPDREYDVQEGRVRKDGEFRAKVYDFKGEDCVCIRSIRNLSFAEEVHEPAYTMMPVRLFFDVYQGAEG